MRTAIRLLALSVPALLTASCGRGTAPGDAVVVHGVEMVYVPGGPVTLGPFRGDSLMTELPPYLIGKREVTNREYREFCELFHIPFSVPTQLDDYPVVEVDLNAADAFAAWKGARLPTEAEWELAAGGPEGFVYPWGDTWDPMKANTRDGESDSLIGTVDGFVELAPVGSFPSGASPFGALDMAGNAMEWTQDWFAPYANQNVPGWSGPPRGTRRVARGGSFLTTRSDARVACRITRHSGTQDRDLGFRLASDYPPRERGALPREASPTIQVDVGGSAEPD